MEFLLLKVETLSISLQWMWDTQAVRSDTKAAANREVVILVQATLYFVAIAIEQTYYIMISK